MNRIFHLFLYISLVVFFVIMSNVQAATEISLTKEQQSFLQSINKINLCVAPNSLPLDGIRNGRHIGIGADYMEIFSSILQIPIVLVITSSWEESIKFIKNGKCDIISLITETPQRQKYLYFTENFVHIDFVIITTKEKHFISNLDDIAHERLGIHKGYAYTELLRNRYPDMNLIEFDTRGEGLKLVDNRNIFGYLTGSHIAGHAIQSDGYTNLKINAEFDEFSVIELGIGVCKERFQLRNIFNKAIAVIDPKDKSRIENTWKTVKYDIVESHHNIILITVVASIVFLFLFYRQYYLRKYNKRLAKNEKKNWKEANFDFLTGLLNRRFFSGTI